MDKPVNAEQARPGRSSWQSFSAAVRLLVADLSRDTVLRLVGANMLAIAGGALAGLAPVALKGMIDTSEGSSAPRDASSSIVMYGAAYLLCLSLGRLITEVRPLLISAAEQQLYAGLRGRYFRHLLDLPLSFHHKQRTGTLIQHLHQAVSGYQVIMFSLVNGAVPVLIEAATVAIVLISLRQTGLTVTFALTALAYVAALNRGTTNLGSSANEVARASVDAHSLMADSLINYEPIKCFVAEQAALDRFARYNSRLQACWGLLQRQRLGIGLIITMVFALSLTASLVIAVRAVSEDRLTTGGFVLASLYMVQILRPLEIMGAAVRDLLQGLAFIRPLMDVLDEAPERSPLPDAGAELQPTETKATTPSRFADPKPPSLSFQAVQLAFGGADPVLNNFSLEVTAGHSVALVGASGCGKSSLVRLLLRLYQPLSGAILLNGRPIDELQLAELRSMIAVVPQDVVLFNADIFANIAIAKTGATAAEIENAARLAGIHDFVSALPCGYHTELGERGLTLSGGERQRIAIARAVLRNPLIYVFDEATSMLDGPTEDAILRSLKEIAVGRTTITIAHRLSTIQHADEIAVIAKGVVVERGDHATLLSMSGRYAAMWHLQLARNPPR